MTIDPCANDPRNVYKLMVHSILPRPIAFVSTISAKGVRNLAPFSFFTGVSADPPVVCFAPMFRGSDGSAKDTLRNVEETGEFVVNVVSEDISERMNLCSPEYAPDVDEFAVSGLTALASQIVRAPRVGESKVSMECRLTQIVEVSRKPSGGSLVIGEIVLFHVADEIFENFRIDPDKLAPIGRLGGAEYVRVSDRFTMLRPATRR